MKILVTGGAGYIGSVAVKMLVEKGYEVVVIDNLSKGKKEIVNEKAKLYVADLIDKEAVEKVFSENKIDSVMHFASYKAVEESMQNAVKYSDNITGLINLLNAMVKFNVKKIVFSSSAAVYGIPDVELITESTETRPINFYGFSKLEGENIIKWYEKIYGIEYVFLRYFNVAGDGGLNYIDPNAKNIFPIILEVLIGKREKLKIFGKDYETRDGTCIRDYIDVNDLIEAHILALNVKNEIINLGSSKGHTVLELIRAFEEISKRKINFEFSERRKGDPARLLASNEKAKKVLKWETKRSIKDMIISTLRAYSL